MSYRQWPKLSPSCCNGANGSASSRPAAKASASPGKRSGGLARSTARRACDSSLSARAHVNHSLRFPTIEVIARICQHLDGLPLAIELAASWVTVMPVEEIVDRLEGRFALLTSGDRAATGRLKTLRAAIDWSHELLSEPEKVLFRRLSIFAARFAL